MFSYKIITTIIVQRLPQPALITAPIMIAPVDARPGPGQKVRNIRGAWTAAGTLRATGTDGVPGPEGTRRLISSAQMMQNEGYHITGTVTLK